jgi:hypothetical protein
VSRPFVFKVWRLELVAHADFDNTPKRINLTALQLFTLSLAQAASGKWLGRFSWPLSILPNR